MKLIRLEIRGFKSFPDRTIFEFRPGITAVVGPNGCGKSNIFEAIRWVMGEQKARLLRGQKMGDVIFNGSENRKPLGMAEVRMVVSNDDDLSHPSLLEYDEIMITRRLFRDGDSQYEINNIPCRLSDITDMFLDTGVGRTSYSVVEQGRVEMVVASRPEDRRALIEEAAGINRYKVRKEVALKKLEQTSRNLERIKDVVSEVKRQSYSLRRQAAKAEEYQGVQNRFRDLDIAIHAWKYLDTAKHYALAKNNLDAKTAELSECESALALLEAELEGKRLKLLNLEKAMKDLLQARQMNEINITSVRASIQRDLETIADLNLRLEKVKTEQTDLNEKARKTKMTRARLEKERSQIQLQIRQAQEDLQNTVKELSELQDDRNKHAQLLETLKNDMFRGLQETAQKRNTLDALKKRSAEIDSRLGRIARDHEDLCEGVKTSRRADDLLTHDLTELSQIRTVHLTQKQDLCIERKKTVDLLKLLRDELGSLEKGLAADNAKLESLEAMQRNYECYDQSVRFLMKNQETTSGEALLGPLAELMEVPPEYEKALLAAIGHRLGDIVVLSTRDGTHAASRLKESGKGRSTFIPVVPRSTSISNQMSAVEGSLRLKDLVVFRKGFQDLRDFLLTGFCVVQDMDQAFQIWFRDGHQVDLVTLEGELLNRYGEITGGSWDRYQDEVFLKRREINCLRKEVEALRTTVSGHAKSLHKEEDQLEQISRDVDEMDRLLNDLNVKEVNGKAEQRQIMAQIANSEKTLGILGLEKERLEKDKDEILRDSSKAREEIGVLQNRLSELEIRKNDTKKRLQELDVSLAEKSSQSGELRVNGVRLDEQYRSIDKEFGYTVDALQQIDKSIAGLATEKDSLNTNKQRISEGLREAQTREKALMRQRKALDASLGGLESESVSLAVSVKGLEHQRNSCSTTAKELQDKVHALEIDSVRLEQIVEDVHEKIRELYQVDLRTVSCPNSPPDPDELTKLKARLESLGEVNLAAIAESSHIEDRLQFLREQELDLKRAVGSLFDTIEKINKKTSDLFLNTFEEINRKFQEIFPFLFGGGEASLELTEEQNPLETGLDIVVRPPGKRRQNMSLLSGGEKSLTAIALIFSIFLTRPSPFCLLDEVDAPLDDSNVSRFTKMLKKLADHTQFIIITHNKRTMEAADYLYGVTMEDPGSSTMISVGFPEYSE